MKFRIYNMYLCSRCKHFKLDADEEYKGWWKMGRCKYFKEDVRVGPGKNLIHPGQSCDAFTQGRRGIAARK